MEIYREALSGVDECTLKHRESETYSQIRSMTLTRVHLGEIKLCYFDVILLHVKLLSIISLEATNTQTSLAFLLRYTPLYTCDEAAYVSM